MKKCFAIFFLIIFSFQVLPIKAIGRILAKSQNTEEVKEFGDDDGKTVDEDLFLLSLSGDNAAQHLHFIERRPVIIHIAESVPLNHSREVQSPPPDSNC